ncbi:MAG TPA: hypothetical protein VHN79_05565 [Lacunisphaera sp.]|nr:hypothetical protein [Lacunisphaera sp.]
MQARPLLLCLSLLGNAALAALYLSRPAAPAPAPAPGPLGASPETSVSSAAEAPRDQPASGGAALPESFSWATIATDDLDELARRLRAAGFTGRETRLILAERIAQLTSAGRPNSPATTPYWRSGRVDYNDPKQAEELRQRMVEQNRLFQKYVMDPAILDEDPDYLVSAQQRWGELPHEKLKAIAAIEADYQEMQLNQAMARPSRPGDPASTVNPQLLLEEERLADIARILTPEEFAEYELRASRTASVLRSRLEAFKPDEAEYKALFAIHKAYDARLNDRQLGAGARQALQEEITRQVAAALGADRALDYDAAMNHNGRDQTALLVARLDLPARVAVEIRQAQQEFSRRGADLRANAALPAAERDAQLAALARQAAAQLAATLGADGFEAYSDIKGEWLRALHPTPLNSR